MNRCESSTEDEQSTKATSTSSGEDSSDHDEEDEEDDEMSTTDNSQLQLNANSNNCSGLRWDRSRSRRYNLEMLREYEHKRCMDIVGGMLEVHKLKTSVSKVSDDDDDADEVAVKSKEESGGPDPRGIYVRIESRWRREHVPTSPLRQSTSTATFTRKTSSVMAAARFKSVNRHQHQQSVDKH